MCMSLYRVRLWCPSWIPGIGVTEGCELPCGLPGNGTWVLHRHSHLVPGLDLSLFSNLWALDSLLFSVDREMPRNELLAGILPSPRRKLRSFQKACNRKRSVTWSIRLLSLPHPHPGCNFQVKQRGGGGRLLLGLVVIGDRHAHSEVVSSLLLCSLSWVPAGQMVRLGFALVFVCLSACLPVFRQVLMQLRLASDSLCSRGWP